MEPGLQLTLASRQMAMPVDKTVVPNVWLYVGEMNDCTPFSLLFHAIRFNAVFEGNINAELRGDYIFRADLRGSLQLEINGHMVLEDERKLDGLTPASKPVRLDKGPNRIKATFTNPGQGDSILRLEWSEKGRYFSPIPNAALDHEKSPTEIEKAQLHLGRELFLERRCAKCHTVSRASHAAPELSMDAPTFEGIGARRNFEWMSRWILDPKTIRPMAEMPKLLHGAQAKEEATAIAAHLATLKNDPATSKAVINTPAAAPTAEPKKADEPSEATDTKPLFERLHCIGCHNPPASADPDPKKIPLKHVGEKFAPGKLAEFLRAPEAHFAWIRMPNFRLSAAEANEIANWLLADAPKAKAVSAPTDAATLERGKSLVQSSGCLNCHNLTLENKFKAPALSAFASSTTKITSSAACIGTAPFADFGFAPEEKKAVQAFVGWTPETHLHHVPADFAERQTRLLNCAACHGQVEGFPPLEILGGKLKPEWSAKFIAGEIAYKPRGVKHPNGGHWLEMRMPSFKSRAAWLAEGLAAQHGYPTNTPAELPVNLEMAKLGQKLVGKDGGLSCISCHAVGSLEPTEVFESEGINLARSAERLLPEYYRRWTHNPQSIDPQTKMPMYFDEERSSLPDVLEGDADRQIQAIWEYLRLGSKMPLPSTAPQ